MTDNRTSKAVENWIILAPRPFGGDIVLPFNLNEVISVCEKYKRMEEALNEIAGNDETRIPSFVPVDVARAALAFDPLSA